ncbi:MAG TPA: nucleotide 5'-monophosphate nucleosidase PpnN [Nevskiaceae bacterium]|nr:nucleotide 5'-monophosphate nucleosidase PpnN [Nevskiaceae bacterium]
MKTQPYDTIDARVAPEGRLRVMSRAEVARLLDNSQGGLYPVFRNSALAVLATGSNLDDSQELLERYPAFDIRVVQEEHGVVLDIRGAPATAFVDGTMIRGVREHLSAVLRDILFVAKELLDNPSFDLRSPQGITDAVFHILRNAGLLRSQLAPNLVVCWGGHSIPREEYDYTKKVGYELGLRGLDVCTGCGPGAMKGPMKGAALAHAKQRNRHGRYIGLTEPGIIAAESPNPIVSELAVCPDIEKRLEAFVRIGHGVLVFPGGVGTAEEILYLLGLLLHPDNQDLPFPLILTGPVTSSGYFEQIDAFIGLTLGESARARYRILLGEPDEAARTMLEEIKKVREFRAEKNDAYYFNWRLRIPADLQQPFQPTHEAMRSLDLHLGQPPHQLASNLRRAFSGIVAGNVKADTLRAVQALGPFEINGDPVVLKPLDALLEAFVMQGRMKLPGKAYVPCYRVVV